MTTSKLLYSRPHLIIEERRQELHEQLVGAHDDQHLPQKGVEGDGKGGKKHQLEIKRPVWMGGESNQRSATKVHCSQTHCTDV
jgi:hypothetical protein